LRGKTLVSGHASRLMNYRSKLWEILRVKFEMSGKEMIEREVRSS
jgi:hypothetical protein